MPLPLIPSIFLLGSAIAGVKGAVDSVSAVTRISRLQETYRLRRALYEGRELRYKRAFSRLDRRLQELNKLRLRALDTLREAARFLVRARVRERHFSESIDAPVERLDDWQGVSVQPHEALNGLVEAGRAGVTTAATIYSLVGMLGTASTGTAISTLSGAAATNATLAWLGGGALAASGGGIALGTVVLGGLVAGPTLLVGSFFLNGKLEQIRTEVDLHTSAMDVAEARMQQHIAGFNIIQARIEEVESTIQRLNRTLTGKLAVADPNRLEDVFEVAKVAWTLAEVIDVKALTQPS